MDQRNSERWEEDERFEEPPRQVYVESPSWGRAIGGSLTLIAAVFGAAFWAGGRSAHTRAPSPVAGAGALADSTIEDQGARRAVFAGEPRNTRDTVVLAARPQEWAEPKLTRMSVSFFLPPEGTVVPPTMLVRGMAKGIPGDRQLWLVTRREPSEGIWPKEEVSLRSDGVFEVEIWEFGADGTLSVCLLVTDDDETSRYDDWLLAGDRADEWPALRRDKEHSTVLGCRNVTLLKPKFQSTP